MARFFAGLAQRAAARPELPWLFFRRDLDWRWRSHRQVADHLARAAAAVKDAAGSTATALPLAGAEALTAHFAILAAGKEYVALEDALPGTPFLTPADAKWPDLLPESWQGEVITFPACRGNVERYQPAPLPEGPFGTSLEKLEERAAGIAAGLFAPDAPRGKKIVHAGARLAGEDAAALLIATLFEPGTALALEPYPPATLESILWCRPTHVAAHADEIAELVAAWSGKVPKRSRLRRVLVTSGEVDPAWTETLGIPVTT